MIIGDACSRHLYALQRAIITKDKIELQGSIGSNFMPKYRKVRSNDKHVPEFMRKAICHQSYHHVQIKSESMHRSSLKL